MKNYVQTMTAKPFDIEAGKMITLLNSVDAEQLGVLPMERVEIYCPRTKKRALCVLDITNTMLKENELGMFNDVREKLGAKAGDVLKVQAVPPPKSVCFIKKKLDGKTLNEGEIKAIVKDLGEDKLSDIEAAAFVSAVYIHGYNLNETVAMTRALTEDGLRLHLKKGPVLDKHCVGGTNGRTTMLVVPIIAAAGFYIPKTSSRSITSAAGTADAMEVLANVSLSLKQIKEITERVGGVIAWGGALDLAPVDDKIIKIEHPFSLDPPGQIIASVMSKKASVNAEYVVIDMPVGPDVKVTDKKKAKEMAKKFIAVGENLGMKVEAVMTDGTEPCGKAFGAALEAKEVMEILEGKSFGTLAQKSCELAGVLFELVGKTRKGKGTEYAKNILLSGRALKKMKEIIKAQGKKVLSSKEIEEAKFKKSIKAESDGEISRINIKEGAKIAKLAGAPGNKKAGVKLLVGVGDTVKKNKAIYEIHAENKRKLDLAVKYAKESKFIEMRSLILEKFS